MFLMVGCLDGVAVAIAKELTKKSKVVMVDKNVPAVKQQKDIITYDVALHGDDYVNLFRTFSFDAVIFLPPRDSFHAAQKRGDLSDLASILDECVKHHIKNIIYVSSSEAYFGGESGEADETSKKSALGVLLTAGENMCASYAKEFSLPIRVFHVPYLFADDAADTVISDAVRAIHDKKEAVLKGTELEEADFLYTGDLADFILRYIDEGYELSTFAINLPGTGSLTYLDLAELLRAKWQDSRVSLTDLPHPVAMKNETAKKMYDWQPYVELKDRFPALSDALLGALPNYETPFKRFVKRLTTKNNVLVAVELILGFVFLQWITGLSVASSQLNFVDFRLLFVMILGTVHGMRAGIFAAVLATVSYVIAYVNTGLNWQILAYNIANWMPIVMYFLVGAIIGHGRDKIVEQAKASDDERMSVEEKYAFLYELYNQSIKEKESLKEQIMGYSDTYGRFYRAVQKLNSMLPDEVLLNAVECMEDFLANRSIAVYGMDKNGYFARLSICSTPLSGKLGKSMRLDNHKEMMEQVKNRQMWINRELLPDQPAYCMPVMNDDEIVALIAIWEATPDQYTTDYVNRVHMLVGMTQISIVRAMNYQDMTEDEAFLPGTHIYGYEKFKETCKLRFSMQRKDMARFSLIRITNENMSFPEIEKVVNSLVRQLDIMGVDSKNRLYVLLSQADKDNVNAVKERLRAKGISCE